MNQDPSESGDSAQQREQSGSSARSLPEWITLGVSVAIISAVFVLISVLYLSGTDEPPLIVVEARTEELRHEESGYYLPVDVVNEGDRTVEDVVVEAELDTGSGQPYSAEITVTFLGGGEQVHATFVFQQDPTRGDLTIGAVSYKTP